MKMKLMMKKKRNVIHENNNKKKQSPIKDQKLFNLRYDDEEDSGEDTDEMEMDEGE